MGSVKILICPLSFGKGTAENYLKKYFEFLWKNNFSNGEGEIMIFRKLDSIHNKILAVFNGVGSFWIFILMAVIVVDVLGRVCIGKPLQGTPEIVSNSIIAITFLQIPYVMLKKQHVRSTIFYDKLSSKGKDYLDIAVSLLGIALFIMLIISSWDHFITAIKIGEFEGEGALRVPTAPTRFILILGSFFMILEYIMNIFRILTHNKSIEKEDEEASL